MGFIVRGEGERIRNQAFTAKAENLAEDQANILAEYMKLLIQNFPENGLDRAMAIAKSINYADTEQRSGLLEMMRHFSDAEINQQQEISLDLL